MSTAPGRCCISAPAAAPLCPHIEAALGQDVRAAQQGAASPPVAGADPKPRWTLKRLVGFVQARFAQARCRETIRSASDVTTNIGGVSQAATETGQAAGQVLSAAGDLSRQAEQLTSEVGGFIAEVRAA